MRGEILIVESGGGGLISGDDQRRYRFERSDVTGGLPVQGAYVDFVPESEAATLLVVLHAEDFAFGGLPPPAPRLTPWQHFKRCCTSAYFLSEGRAGMTEYWSFHLIHLALAFAVLVPLMLLMAVITAYSTSDMAVQLVPLAVLLLIVPYFLASLYLLIPGVTALIRRLHDVGHSGWWILIAIIPFGSFALFVLSLMPTQPGPNRFGHPPL